ncbi:hypothetical protein MUK42_18478 [Musa troglodytarum]|uniref:Uncharacterized protein n=1 Tax=Musa troglodytarum TaxID=320322 RepID=A0A9E7FWJ0_9LILI|nr:hypothetical protein MUK42_18478 [Musa troglodytarum]
MAEETKRYHRKGQSTEPAPQPPLIYLYRSDLQVSSLLQPWTQAAAPSENASTPCSLLRPACFKDHRRRREVAECLRRM